MKINRYITAAALAAMFATGCYEGELYDEGPDWVADKIAEEAAKKAASEQGGEGEEEETGLKIDLVKYADDFVFNGDAEMVTSEVLMIENGAGGKHQNSVSTKAEGWLKDKISFDNVITVSFDAYPTVNSSDWNYTFCLGTSMDRGSDAWGYLDGTIGFIQRYGDPYFAFFPGGAWAEENEMGGTADNNPYNYFSGLEESNCNKWYHFDYIYSTTEICIYVNGIKSVTHTPSDEEAASIKGILATLNEGWVVIGAGATPANENFGGYIANFTLHNELYVKKGNFFSGEITPKESEIKSLTVTGPESVPFGTTYDQLLEKLNIKVAYEIDGEPREKELSTSDVIINLIPDMSTVGKKTLSVYYNTTYAGKFQKNVKAELLFEVAPLAIESLQIKTDLSSVAYCPGVEPTKMCNLIIAGIQNNGDAIDLDNATLTITKIDADGKFNISYTTSEGKTLTAEGAFGGEKVFGVIAGNGEFVDDEKHGRVYKNNTDNIAIRENYLTLPTDKINECASAGRLTIAFWIKNYGKATINEWSPIFMIKNGDVNSEWLYYIFRHKGQLLVNYAGWIDSPLSAEWSVENDWLNGNDDWHYVVATVAKDDLTLYVDGEVLSQAAPNGTDGNSTDGFINELANINFFALGGAQTNGWGDQDVPCMYSNVTISSTAPTAAEVKAAYEAGK